MAIPPSDILDPHPSGSNSPSPERLARAPITELPGDDPHPEQLWCELLEEEDVHLGPESFGCRLSGRAYSAALRFTRSLIRAGSGRHQSSTNALS